MSGTSLDGVDGALVDFSTTPPSVLGFASAPLGSQLKAELLALNSPGENELHRAALAANALVRVYAQVVNALLQQCGVPARQIRAIGAHGQTVRHRPLEFDGMGYTMQLNQPALLAELSGIDVVADFRSRDLAAGGQGAPLVPPFHQSFFGPSSQSLAVLNIGGISNITLLPAAPTGQFASNVSGYDCGPGNALLDAWCLAHTGAPFDAEGRWGAKGNVCSALLTRMLDEPFFAKKPPKSTGRDLFNTAWLASQLLDFDTLEACDVQATLTELTALACANAVQPGCSTLVVCGGGALNQHLMARLQNALPNCRVASSTEFGLPPLQVEATAFAWLARQAIERKTASLPKVTGAQGARILGGIYPA
jgi:anhydro-N-acetylmuramic acid kinase